MLRKACKQLCLCKFLDFMVPRAPYKFSLIMRPLHKNYFKRGGGGPKTHLAETLNLHIITTKKKTKLYDNLNIR
jgi:hypothetical protein